MPSSDIRNDIRTDIRADILNRLQSWRTRLLWQRSLYCIGFATALFALFRLLGLPEHTHAVAYFSAVLASLIVLTFAALLFSNKWRALTPENFVLHLNRRFPDFEESAQLLLRDDNELGILQRLQKQRCTANYAGNIAKVEAWQPPVQYRNVIVLMLVAGLLALFAPKIRYLSAQIAASREPAVHSQSLQSSSKARLESVTIAIMPPDYTGLLATESNLMDLEVFEGSQIEWELTISGDADTYAIEFSGGRQVPMQYVTGAWQAGTRATSTDLYKVAAIKGGQTTYVGDIYALTVQLDQAPDIKILEPTVTTLEIPKSGPAVFESDVLVSDDFGINSADILASVAKGSGEGVKFRDQTLAFDGSSSTEKGRLYHRHWDMASLDMEPGDEIYFSVIATDNRQPEPNTTRSTTLIIRWLEDEVAGLAADGLAIDFIPEFFKSQRQIIIDTEQLIEDQSYLKQQEFKNTSYQIGRAQAALKQKYGQYLGDEFGEGSGQQFGSDNPAGGHAHDESGVTINNATNINDIVNLFGHDHGAPEIGKVSKQSPVALMKRAVNEMWSAERHLLQAEPELALPFEYEAYKFLKLARQADRIYVKRLGFEPPPVSEENRLTGELKDIRSYSLQQHANPDSLPPQRAEQRLLRQVWQLLGSFNPDHAIDTEQDEVLLKMSDQYKVLSQQRPALIKQAASIEKLRTAKQWRLSNCDGCMQELKQSIWNLMDDGDALLQHPGPVYDNNDEMIRDYRLELRSSSGAQQSMQKSGAQRP